MAKDPAVLFYFQDFLVGTEFMTDEEVGKYIRILCHLADKGSLSCLQILRICKTDTIPNAIKEKLKVDEDGNYYQTRMRNEREKRVNYSESRRNNRIKSNNICLSYDSHMENENEIINEKEIKFKSEVFEFSNKYPEEMLNKFFNYWTEKNKSRTKMRYELEKTFEINRRLVTWASRDNSLTKTVPLQDNISYKELVARFNKGETDIWDKYEPVNAGDKRSLWKIKSNQNILQ